MNYLSCALLWGSVLSVHANDEKYWFGHENYASKLDHQNYDYIEKPCYIQDVNCIQSYLKHNFGCSPVHEHGPDIHYIKSYPLDMPHGNASAVVNDATLYGLKSGKIKTFFVDKRTDTMVLEVQFDSVLLRSPNVVISYYYKGEAPKKTKDFVRFEFRHLSLTWTVEGIHNKNGLNSHVYAYMPNPHPDFKVGHGLILSDGYRVLNSKWLEDINLTIAEAMVKEGPTFMNAYLNTMLCDFGQI